MEIECDAFTDLYSIWDLICWRYLEAVMAAAATHSSVRARSAQAFVLHAVQTFSTQPVWAAPPCCKHADHHVSLDTALGARHPSVHPFIVAAAAYFWECLSPWGSQDIPVCSLWQRLINSSRCLLSKVSTMTLRLFTSQTALCFLELTPLNGPTAVCCPTSLTTQTSLSHFVLTLEVSVNTLRHFRGCSWWAKKTSDEGFSK